MFWLLLKGYDFQYTPYNEVFPGSLRGDPLGTLGNTGPYLPNLYLTGYSEKKRWLMFDSFCPRQVSASKDYVTWLEPSGDCDSYTFPDLQLFDVSLKTNIKLSLPSTAFSRSSPAICSEFLLFTEYSADSANRLVESRVVVYYVSTETWEVLESTRASGRLPFYTQYDIHLQTNIETTTDSDSGTGSSVAKFSSVGYAKVIVKDYQCKAVWLSTRQRLSQDPQGRIYPTEGYLDDVVVSLLKLPEKEKVQLFPRDWSSGTFNVLINVLSSTDVLFFLLTDSTHSTFVIRFYNADTRVWRTVTETQSSDLLYMRSASNGGVLVWREPPGENRELYLLKITGNPADPWHILYCRVFEETPDVEISSVTLFRDTLIWKQNSSQSQNSFIILDLDKDNDGVFDAKDVFPLTGTSWYDTDNDGVGDQADFVSSYGPCREDPKRIQECLSDYSILYIIYGIFNLNLIVSIYCFLKIKKRIDTKKKAANLKSASSSDLKPDIPMPYRGRGRGRVVPQPPPPDPESRTPEDTEDEQKKPSESVSVSPRGRRVRGVAGGEGDDQKKVAEDGVSISPRGRRGRDVGGGEGDDQKMVAGDGVSVSPRRRRQNKVAGDGDSARPVIRRLKGIGDDDGDNQKKGDDEKKGEDEKNMAGESPRQEEEDNDPKPEKKGKALLVMFSDPDPTVSTMSKIILAVHVFLFILTILTVIFAIVPFYPLEPLPVWVQNLFSWIDLFASTIFAMDIIVRFLTRNKEEIPTFWAFLKQSIWDFPAVVTDIPGVGTVGVLNIVSITRVTRVLRLFRVLKLFRVMRLYRRFSESNLFVLMVLERPVVFLTFFTGVLVLCAAVIIKTVEQDRQIGFQSLSNVIWFCLVTVTTIGYGDYAPQSLWSRAVAVGVACLGIGLLGSLSAKIVQKILTADKVQERLLQKKKEITSRRKEERRQMSRLGTILNPLNSILKLLQNTEDGPPPAFRPRQVPACTRNSFAQEKKGFFARSTQEAKKGLFSRSSTLRRWTQKKSTQPPSGGEQAKDGDHDSAGVQANAAGLNAIASAGDVAVSPSEKLLKIFKAFKLEQSEKGGLEGEFKDFWSELQKLVFDTPKQNKLYIEKIFSMQYHVNSDDGRADLRFYDLFDPIDEKEMALDDLMFKFGMAKRVDYDDIRDLIYIVMLLHDRHEATTWAIRNLRFNAGVVPTPPAINPSVGPEKAAMIPRWRDVFNSIKQRLEDQDKLRAIAEHGPRASFADAGMTINKNEKGRAFFKDTPDGSDAD